MIRMIGKLLKTRLNVGSKSEHDGFILVADDGKQVRVIKSGDNPFTNTSLTPLENEMVEIIGEMFNGKLVADSVEKL